MGKLTGSNYLQPHTEYMYIASDSLHSLELVGCITPVTLTACTCTSTCVLNSITNIKGPFRERGTHNSKLWPRIITIFI